ncbi:MAG: hypothetical protein AAGC65_05710 [Mucilaginibacter sp.]|uniref:hypothetical protein n=1 Tax=Mucilaginibacter sp. TaxID=1882438 RepID=UPI0031B3EE98
MKLKITLLAFFLTLFAIKLSAQVVTQEDSLAAGLIYKQQATVISGYGEAKYGIDTKRKSAEASLKRVVLFVGHKLSNKISLFTELEVEDALVANGSSSSKGEIAMEQAFLKFNLNPNTYLVAGLFVPRIGIINENHLPTTFNGVDRPFLEEQIIPTTWREVGVGLYGQFRQIQGLNYSVAVTNGLNSEGFNGNNGIGDGRQLGQAANGLNLGLNAALLYYIADFRFQASGYIGGSTAKEQRVADSLQLNSGAFGNPVTIGEIDGQYNKSGIGIRAIATIINIKNADAINRAFANNTPQKMYGGYAEVGYDLLYPANHGTKSFIVFGRYEYLNLNAKVPSNGIENKANEKHYLVGGFTYKPIRGVSIKGDYVRRITGDFNQALVVTPFPQQVPYFKNDGFINLGVAYNF